MMIKNLCSYSKLNLPGFRFISTFRNLLAICWPKLEYGPLEVQRSRMMNGLQIAAAKSLGAPMGACTVMFQAGSKYEVDDQMGATHFLRAGSDVAGSIYPEFAKSKYLQHHGAYITCSSDRQTISYTMRCPPPVFADMKYYLADIAKSYPRHWQIDDRRQIVMDDLTRITPQERVMDLIQQACFNGPLFNSVFCDELFIDSMSESALRKFTEKNFRSDACAVTSFGIPYEDTLKVGEMIELRRDRMLNREEKQSCPRGGFEYYDLGPNSTTWIAVAVPGCGSQDICCVLKHNIVAAACGTGYVHGGQHDLDRHHQDPLGELVGKDLYTSFRAFNISYPDGGLFGILAQTRACSARNVALQAVEFLSTIDKLDVDQIRVGQQRLKLSLSIQEQDCVDTSEGLALQLLSKCDPFNEARDSMFMIDGICPNEVSAVTQCLASKSSMMAAAVVGDVGAVPHDRELIQN